MIPSNGNGMWLKFTLVLGICPMAVFLDKALLWGWVILCLLFYVGAGLLALYLAGLLLMLLFSLLAGLFSKMFAVLSFPLTMSNMLQRYLAKPWLPFCKINKGTDITKVKARRNSENAGMILYLFLFPLRFLNAVCYNLLIHVPFELFNYLMEVVTPESRKEGHGNFLVWLLTFPWRLLKYPVWHGSLTIVESLAYTLAETFLPTLTLFHGTSEEAAEIIVSSPDRYIDNNCRDKGIWRVGKGNFAGDGIYFAPKRATAEHYSGNGTIIVCRVTLGRTLDLGFAPCRVYKACGMADAHMATEWGLKNGYTTGEWWRSDAGWWEYCMYDWQNRYNYSWRIRPLYVVRVCDNHIQRIPGGMSHWLFRRMVIKDIKETLKRHYNI